MPPRRWHKGLLIAPLVAVVFRGHYNSGRLSTRLRFGIGTPGSGRSEFCTLREGHRKRQPKQQQSSKRARSEQQILSMISGAALTRKKHSDYSTVDFLYL